ncbi:MAG: FAD-dependent oxidoreductase, partial [Brevibacterium aurantiacum]
MNTEFEPTADRVVIIGGGPGGYEAALVAAQLGADVMLIERNRCGGAAVLTDVVPSKSLIATAEMMEEIARSESLGIRGQSRIDGQMSSSQNGGIPGRSRGSK